MVDVALSSFAHGAHGVPSLALPTEHPPVLVFDVETTGCSPVVVCQLACALAREGTVREGNWIFQLPPGARISYQAFGVHGISVRTCFLEGVAPKPVLEYFLSLAHRVKAQGGFVVAHNKGGDVASVKRTAEVWQCPCDLEADAVFCTQKNSTPFSPLLNKNGHRKVFRNEELYEYFYGARPTWARLHDAMDDVRVTLLNFKAMSAAGRVPGMLCYWPEPTGAPGEYSGDAEANTSVEDRVAGNEDEAAQDGVATASSPETVSHYFAHGESSLSP